MARTDRGRYVNAATRLTEQGRPVFADDLTDRAGYGFGLSTGPATITLAARLGLSTGIDGDLTRTVGLSGRLGAVMGLDGALTVVDVTVPLAARLGLVAGLSGDVTVAHDLAARLGLVTGIRPDTLSTAVGLAARLGLVVGLAGELDQGNVLAARIGLVVGTRADVTITAALAARLGLMLGVRDDYTGPGTGLVVEGLTAADWLAVLQPGDTFRATLPYAGLQGKTGLVRVLSRTLDERGLLSFTLQFVPTTDVPTMRSIIESGRPRYVPPTTTNPQRRLVDVERRVHRLRARD